MKILYRIIAKEIYLMPEGISQVLFVVSERFTAEEILIFKIFKKVIFKTGIAKCITVVRTKFGNFGKKEECDKDKKYLCEERKTMAKIVKRCVGIVYVDNPTINILASDVMIEKELKLIKKEENNQELY